MNVESTHFLRGSELLPKMSEGRTRQTRTPTPRDSTRVDSSPDRPIAEGVADRSRAESALDRALLAAEAYVAQKLFHAIDAVDLRDKIDTLLEDESYWRLHGVVSQCVDPNLSVIESFAEGKLPAPEVFFIGAGDTYHNLVVSGWVLSGQVANAVLQFIGWRAKNSTQSDLVQTEPRPFLDVLYDRKIPAVLRRGLLARERASLCEYAIAAARNSKPVDWIRETVLHTWINSSRVYLQFLAALPGVEVPATVLPLAERVPPQKLSADDLTASHDGRSLRLADAKDSGVKVFPCPEASHDDD